MRRTVHLGEMVRPRDAFGGVLAADLVVVLRHLEGDTFAVEEMLLASAPHEETLVIPGVRLTTYSLFDEPMSLPITKGTRILTFLKQTTPDSGLWTVVPYSHNSFWVEDPAQVDKLREIASEALRKREAWLAVNAVEDPAKRVEAIWPFLWMTASSTLAREALIKIGPPAGDYLADHLADMPHHERMQLIQYAGLFGGEKLHRTMRLEMEKARARVMVLREARDAAAAPSDERTRLQREVMYALGEIYYGIAGLTWFKDRNDLPFIRELALWAANIGGRQPCEGALRAFHEMPADENLPVIEAISHAFPDRRDDIASWLIWALEPHKSLKAAPVLIELLGDRYAARDARWLLGRLAGQDLGEAAEPWLQWYREQREKEQGGDRPTEG